VRPFPTLRNVFIVGLGHKARHGKDTAAAAICAAFGAEAYRIGFADAVRAVCRVNHEMTEKDAALLQQVGVGRRQTDPDVWVRAVAWAVHDWSVDRNYRPGVVVVPDVRFPNEAQWIRENHGLLVCITRYAPDGVPFVSGDRPTTHISETALTASDFHLRIDNLHGRPEVMQQRLVQLVQRHYWAWAESFT
jgi:hypothetical protein